MFRVAVILSLLFACSCCLEIESRELEVEDARAMKKKSRVRLWRIILLLVFSKVVLSKVASVVLFVMFFQKFCYLIGLLLNYLLKNKEMSQPQTEYGPPEYNTVGYSYGPPEHEIVFRNEEPYPWITDLGSSLNWLFSKNSK